MDFLYKCSKWKCEFVGMRGRRGRQEDSTLVRAGFGRREEGFHGQGGGRPHWAATETLSAAWLPPKDSASSSPPCISLLYLPPLSPPFVHSLLHPPVPPARSLSLTLSLRFSHFLGFFPPLHVWAITDTQQRAERWGWVAAVVGWGDWGGTKAQRCSGPTRVAGFEKKPDSFLMQRVDRQLG